MSNNTENERHKIIEVFESYKEEKNKNDKMIKTYRNSQIIILLVMNFGTLVLLLSMCKNYYMNTKEIIKMLYCYSPLFFAFNLSCLFIFKKQRKDYCNDILSELNNLDNYIEYFNNIGIDQDTLDSIKNINEYI